MKHLALLVLLVSGLVAADAPRKPEEKKPKPVNALCPVTDEKIDPAATAQYKGKTIAFCCSDCAKEFNKEPAKYIKKVEAEEAKNKKAEKDKADKDKNKGEQPAPDSTKPVNTLCPVEKENAVDETVATTVYKGKTVGFCCDDCIKKFERDPDAFAANLK